MRWRTGRFKLGHTDFRFNIIQEKNMVKQISFTKYEHQLVPEFREKINKTESLEDVREVFSYALRELFENIFKGKITVTEEDIIFTPDKDPHYMFSDQLKSQPDFMDVWKNSDLPRLVQDLADSAVRRYKHIKKHPERTESKIRM